MKKDQVKKIQVNHIIFFLNLEMRTIPDLEFSSRVCYFILYLIRLMLSYVVNSPDVICLLVELSEVIVILHLQFQQ